jgi:hypothetical protein
MLRDSASFLGPARFNLGSPTFAGDHKRSTGKMSAHRRRRNAFHIACERAASEHGRAGSGGRDPNTHGVSLQLFTTIATLGTPQNITAQELRIECFFPMNDETATTGRSCVAKSSSTVPIPAECRSPE